MADVTTIGGRIKTTIGGLFLMAFTLIFVAAGTGIVVSSARKAATYLPVVARVDKVTGGGDASDNVSVAYSFEVDGKQYTGTETADEDSKARFDELRRYKVGQPLTVYYDPRNPAKSQYSVKADAMGLVFVIFVLPFLAMALNQFWQGLTGRELVRSRQPNAQSDAVPGGGLFWVFVGACVAGTVLHIVLCSLLRWPWNLVGGLTILFVAIPAVTFAVIHLVRRSRQAKREARWERDAGSMASEATVAQEDADDADDDDEATAGVHAGDFTASAGSLGKKLGIALAITIFWCGITGVFAWFAIGALVKHYYARQHFASTPGVVLASKVKVSSGSEGGSTSKPRIKYRYTVAGKEYIGDQYDFADISSSDGSYAHKAVSENPPGKTVTVYYDPNDPSDAILHLEAPAGNYFILLFLQPFMLVGLALIAWCVSLPFNHGRMRQFLDGGNELPCRIPGWGVLQQDLDGLVLRRRRNWFAPLGHFIVGYGLACFFAIFVVGFFFHGFGDANPDAVRGAFIVAAAVGVIAALRKLLLSFGGSRLVIDPIGRRLAVFTRRRSLEAPLNQVAALRLREIPYPTGVTVNGQRIRYLLLEAELKADEPLPLHAFRWQAGQEGELIAVAQQSQALLAGLIGCPAATAIIDDEPAASAQPSGPLAGFVGLFRGGAFGDLT